MDRKVGLRLCELAMEAGKDPEYQAILEEYRSRDAALRLAMETMTENQRSAVMDYGGVTAQLYLMQIELACTRLIQLETEKTRE